MTQIEMNADGKGVSVEKKGRFSTTHWSVVTEAAKDSPQARAALSDLCERYWYPLYIYVRRKGYDRETAADLVQNFFTHLLERNFLAAADPGRGKFRTYLIVALKRHIDSWWRVSRAQKRYPSQIVSWDVKDAERRYRRDYYRDEETPETIYERQWAQEVVKRAGKRLEEEFREKGQAKVFKELRGYLAGTESRGNYKYIAQRLDTTEGMIAVAVHRMRNRYLELLEQEVADTVKDPEKAEEELGFLLSVLGRSQ